MQEGDLHDVFFSQKPRPYRPRDPERWMTDLSHSRNRDAHQLGQTRRWRWTGRAVFAVAEGVVGNEENWDDLRLIGKRVSITVIAMIC